MGMKISDKKFNQPLPHSIHSVCLNLHFNVNFILSFAFKIMNCNVITRLNKYHNLTSRIEFSKNDKQSPKSAANCFLFWVLVLLFNQFLVHQQFLVQNCLTREWLLVLVDHVGFDVENDFSFWCLLQFVSDFTEHISRNDQVLELFVFLKLGDFLPS